MPRPARIRTVASKTSWHLVQDVEWTLSNVSIGMTTLGPGPTTVFPCYAAADRSTADTVASFLEAGGDARVFLAEGEIGPNEDLLSKVGDAHAADVILVLFSHHCPLAPGTRSQWERVLVEEPKVQGVRIGFVQCDDWAPPRTLLHRFDCRGLAPDGLRKLKRWVRGRVAPCLFAEGVGFTGAPSELDRLGIALADRPGVRSIGSAALAYAFVRAYAEDFDEVFRLACAGRTPAALAGDLGAQIGQRLESDLPGNLEQLREFCSARRFLILLEDPAGIDAGQFTFGGNCSTLTVAESGPMECLCAESLPAIQAEFTHPGGDWLKLCRLARIGRRVARDQNRIAELYELMLKWYALAEAHGDRHILDESAREMVWVLEGWGRFTEASRLEYRRAAEFDQQMPLPFGEGW